MITIIKENGVRRKTRVETNNNQFVSAKFYSKVKATVQSGLVEKGGQVLRIG
jgi:hypothetical protein